MTVLDQTRMALIDMFFEELQAKMENDWQDVSSMAVAEIMRREIDHFYDTVMSESRD